MSSEERMQILKMIENGKISAEEGMKLMEAVDSSQSSDEGATTNVIARPRKKKFRIQVFEGDMNKPKVNVNIPLGLAEIATKFVPKSVQANMNVGGEAFDLREVIQMVQNGEDGTLLEVEDADDKTRVIISVD